MRDDRMNRRHFLKAVGGGVGGVALTRTLYAQQAMKQNEDDPRPNIMLIITDQHTHDIISCAGCDWVQTPNMDRIAQHGTRFSNAHVA